MKIGRIIIAHLIGSVIITLTLFAFYNYYLYSSFIFLQNIVNSSYTEIITMIIIVTVYLVIGLVSVYNANLKRDKLFILKCVLFFALSCLILYILYSFMFYSVLIISIAIWGF